MNTCMSEWQYYSTAPIGIFKSANFSEQILPVSGLLSLPFLTRFPRMRCHIYGQVFGNKMYISELFTVVRYLHTAGFKNHQGIYCAKCTSWLIDMQTIPFLNQLDDPINLSPFSLKSNQLENLTSVQKVNDLLVFWSFSRERNVV